MFKAIKESWKKWRTEVHQDKAIKRYHKVLDKKAERSWWNNVTRKDYTVEELERLFKFAQDDREEHEKFWKDYNQADIKTPEDQKEVTACRYATQQTAEILLTLAKLGDPVTMRLARGTE